MADEKKRRIEQEEQRIEEEKLKEEERQKIKEERRRRREEKRRGSSGFSVRVVIESDKHRIRLGPAVLRGWSYRLFGMGRGGRPEGTSRSFGPFR